MYNVCALYNQLSEQGLVAYTEMQMPLLGGLSVEKTGARKEAERGAPTTPALVGEGGAPTTPALVGEGRAPTTPALVAQC